MTTTEAYARAPADPVSVSPASFAIERDKFDRALTSDDLMENLHGCEEEMFSAFRTGDANLIGRVVLSVMDAYVQRLTVRETGCSSKTFDAEQMATIVLQSHSAERAMNRRSV